MTLDTIIRKAFVVYVATNDQIYSFICSNDPYTSSEASVLKESQELMNLAKEVVRGYEYPDARSKAICMYHIGEPE